MIVERKVQKSQIGLITNLRTPYETKLIERSTITLFVHHAAAKITVRLIGIKAKTQSHIVTPVKSDTRRIRTDGRQISTQCTHCTSHTYKAGRTIHIIS